MTTQLLEQEIKQRNQRNKPSAKKPEIVDVPPMNFLMVDGAGDPNTSQAYRDAVEALYGVSYALKFTLKKVDGVVYSVAPLEGLWWSEEMSVFLSGERTRWQWTMMLAQPSPVTEGRVAQVIEEVRRKKNPAALPLVRFAAYHEGLAAQIMHIGPYAAEAPTIQRLHAFIHEEGGVLQHKHHEIYLGDPRRSAPEKLKTVIRQPFRRG
ncbi:hypothetical protein GC175_11650 [bacterium]|nr:hypothetical protein [bacterium]